jgi:hypothetical protein
MLLGCVLRAEGDSDGARSAFEAALRIGRRNGSNWHLAGAILGLALPGRECGRLGTGSHAPRHRAGFTDRTGQPWQEDEARVRWNGLDQAHADLGDEQLERACSRHGAQPREGPRPDCPESRSGLTATTGKPEDRH